MWLLLQQQAVLWLVLAQVKKPVLAKQAAALLRQSARVQPGLGQLAQSVAVQEAQSVAVQEAQSVAGEVPGGVAAPRQQQVGALRVRAKQGLLFRQVVVLAGLAFFRLVRWRLVCLPQAY